MKRILLLTISVCLLFYSCQQATSPPSDNIPPFTELSNIPVPGDTLFPRVQIIWDGGDEDGYITGCEYCYTTYHLETGDSVYFDWVKTGEEIIELIFESSDVVNKQKFRLRAIDDKGAVDPTPAELILYTPQTVVPVTTILYPFNSEKFFYLHKQTDWWQGIPLQFTATDADGEVVEYGVSIDDGEIFWTEDTTLTITPDMFKQPLAGKHTIWVTAKDNTKLYDPKGVKIEIELVYPEFTRGLLIIDETKEDEFPSTARISDAAVDSFYTALFNPDTTWDFFESGFPPKELLGQFKVILWHADHQISIEEHKLPRYANEMMDYLNSGGNLIVSGWQVLSSFAYGENIEDLVFEEGSFMHDYLHINRAGQTPVLGNFTGARGKNGYSFRVNPALVPNFPYKGMLNSINIIEERGGFTEGIYFFFTESKTYETLSGKTVGIRYYGTVYDVIVLCFPLYFLMPDDAAVMATEIMQKIKP